MNSNKLPDTVELVNERITELQHQSTDDEVAHSLEDKLMVDVLTAISKGLCKDPQDVARACLKTRKMKFSRWCA